MLLANTVLAGWTFLALRTHCAEIVRDRDHGEEYDQNASHASKNWNGGNLLTREFFRPFHSQ